MGVILTIIILISIGYAISILIDTDIQVGIFTSLCLVVLVIGLCAAFGIMSTGFIIVYVLSIMAIVYGVYIAIKNKTPIKEILQSIFTPGTIVLLLVVAIYSMLVQGMVLMHDDEAGSWTIEVWKMLFSNKYVNLNGHRHYTGFFTAFCINIMGGGEHNFFIAKWIFMWVALTMPLRNIKWTNWGRAMVYAIGAWWIVMMINDSLFYYMDTVNGVLAGSICATWSFSTTKQKDYIWLLLGLYILLNIKEELGAILAILAMLFCIMSMIVDRANTENRPSKKIDIAACSAMVLGLIYFASQSGITRTLRKVTNGIRPIYIIGLIASVIVIVGAIYLYRKAITTFIKNQYKAIIPAIITIAILLMAAVFSIANNIVATEQARTLRTIAVVIFNGMDVLGLSASLVIALIIIHTVTTCYMLKNDESKKYGIKSVGMLIIVFTYILALIAGYLINITNNFNLWLRNIPRYSIPILMVAVIWMLSNAINYKNQYKKSKYAVVSIAIAMLILLNGMPQIGTVALANTNEKRQAFTEKIRPNVKYEADYIIANIEKDDKIMYMCTTENNGMDPFTYCLWLRYELREYENLSRILPGGDDYPYTSYESPITPSEYESLFLGEGKDDIDYLYIHSTNGFFKENYGYTFINKSAISKGLYKVIRKNGKVKFEYVGQCK